MDFSRRSKGRTQDAINLTPLIDVVFILLIFFMLTSTFRTERGIDLSLPTSETADQKAEESDVLTISINEQGLIFIDKLEVPLTVLAQRVELFVAKHSDGQIIIKSDGKADVQTLVSVMDRLREAKAGNVTLAAEGLAGQ